MINHISIKNFAIIKNIEIDFTHGFSTITGETGAGKSIIIEALTMALGDRADKTFVRTGESKAVIQILIELDGEEHTLYREISSEGKSLCKIDGEIVTLAHQREYAKKVADIHGQYSHQSLLDEENHINIVDSFMGDTILPLKENVSNYYSEYSQLSKEYNALLSSKNSDEKEKEFIKYQLSEINSINPQKDEDIQLIEEIKIVENREKILNILESSYDALYQKDDSILGQLMTISKNFESIKNVYDSADSLSSLSLDIYYNLDALSQNIRTQKDSIPSSSVSLDELNERFSLIESLKRKHGGTLELVFEFKERGNLLLLKSEDKEEMLATLLNKKNQAEENLNIASRSLSNKRKELSHLLEKKITEELAELNFTDGAIEINFEEKDGYTSNGIDNITLLIKTNKGEIFKPLAKIASGGEMSRVMLAFKNIISRYDNIPTIIFDEIDSGISGQTASVVGRKLLEIGKTRQVIAITHLPQVAALGDSGYAIVKEEDDFSTFTTVKKLNNEERLEEIARLLSGDEITPSSLENARTLLSRN